MKQFLSSIIILIVFSILSFAISLPAFCIPERALDHWKRTCEVAIQNYHAGRYAEAESQFKKALMEIRAVASDSNQELFTLARLTEISLIRKNSKKADLTYGEVESLYKKLKDSKRLDKEGISELDRLADSFSDYKTRDDKRRERYLLTCLKLRDIVSGDNHKKMVGILRKIVVFYVTRAKYQAAEPYAVRLLRLDQQREGFESINVAMELCNLGRIKFGLGKNIEAESYLRQSLAIYLSKDKVQPGVIPSLMVQLTRVLLASKKYELANTEASRSLDLSIRTFGKYSKETINSRDIYADTLKAVGRAKDSSTQREISVKLVNKYYGINNPMNIKNLKELEKYYRATGSLSKARAVSKELRIIEAITRR